MMMPSLITMSFCFVDYWHQTVNNKSPSISISSSVLGANNFKEVISELEEECAGRGAIFHPTGNTCVELKNTCYAIWRDMFSVGHEDNNRRRRGGSRKSENSEEGSNLLPLININRGAAEL